MRLLGGEGDARGLAMEPHPPAPRVAGAVAIAHVPRPDAAGGAELGDLLEEVVVHVPEEREPRREPIHVELPGDPVLHVAEAVGEGEGQLLRRRGARLPDVVARDADRVPVGRVLRGPLEQVDDDLERGLRREDPGVLRHVLLEDVVLDGALESVDGHALALGGGDVEAE